MYFTQNQKRNYADASAASLKHPCLFWFLPEGCDPEKKACATSQHSVCRRLLTRYDIVVKNAHNYGQKYVLSFRAKRLMN